MEVTGPFLWSLVSMLFTEYNYRKFCLKFTKFAEVRTHTSTERSYRVQLVDHISEVDPLLCTCSIVPIKNELHIQDMYMEGVSPLDEAQLMLAAKCFVHGMSKFCRIHNIPVMKIKHSSPLFNKALHEINVCSVRRDIVNINTSIYCAKINC